MSDAIDLDEYGREEFERKAAMQQAATVATLRDLADRIERLRDGPLVEALPVAAWGVAELEQHLAPWLR